MPQSISPMTSPRQATNDIEAQIIHSGIENQAIKRAQSGMDAANSSLNCCSCATACAANLAMLYLGKVLTQYQTAHSLNANPHDACTSLHPELANPMSRGVVLATGAFAIVLALPSLIGLVGSVIRKNSA